MNELIEKNLNEYGIHPLDPIYGELYYYVRAKDYSNDKFKNGIFDLFALTGYVYDFSYVSLIYSNIITIMANPLG